MRKLLLCLLVSLFACLGIKGQTYLTDKFQPTSSKGYGVHTSNGKSVVVARYNYTGGFTLRIYDKKPVYAVFSLKGAYDKISFVIGPNSPNSAADGYYTIVTVRGDGEKLFDHPVFDHDAPMEVVLDIKGVDELRFETVRGEEAIAFGEVKLWKAGETVVPAKNPIAGLPGNKVKLVEQLLPLYIRHSGRMNAITQDKKYDLSGKKESVSVNRVTFTSGLVMSIDQALIDDGKPDGWAYFWLQKKYDKLSFILGPYDNQSQGGKSWFTVKADGKIIYEKLVVPTDLAEQVVLDVKGVDVVSFFCKLDDSDFLGEMTFCAVDIFAYGAGEPVPESGVVNLSQGKLSALPDVVKLCSNIKPYSVRGVGSYNNTYFDGSSDYYTFSMGGEKFSEGFILTTGTTLLDDLIDSYVSFDLAGEYDWISFKAGCLTNHRVLDDDYIRVYADDQLVLDTKIYCTWPNQYFEIPIYKCRTLRFEKPGKDKNKQVYIGIGDAVLYRGKPVPNNLFVHEKPDCPETADLIDLCQRPYFHYVGRYLSSLTNFDFNDCFKNGSSQREFFQMKDGSKIYKGVMLETNVPLGFEDISLGEALFMFVAGAGEAMSSSSVAAATGVSAGVGAIAGGMSSMYLVGEGGGQSSVVAFNPYGEYETCTFTVANKSEYIDAFDEIIGGAKDAPPVKLMVFADRRVVGEFWVSNKMKPTTYTVPINKCTQLMFWLVCDGTRSGQYVLYDMTVSKKPMVVVSDTPAEVTRQEASSSKSDNSPRGERKKKKEKTKDRVAWVYDGKRSGDQSIDSFLKEVDDIWKATEKLSARLNPGYTKSEVYVEASDGSVYKCVSFVDSRNNRLSTTDLQKSAIEVSQSAKDLQITAGIAKIDVASATLGIVNLPLEKMGTYRKLVKLATDALNQCSDDLKQIQEAKDMELETIQDYIKRAIDVGDKKSTAHVMILRLQPGEKAPKAMQRLEYFNF